MKKVLSLILAAVMLLGCMSITAFAADSEGLVYELNGAGDGYIVTGIGTCTDTDVVIPASYNDLPVTEIGMNAFHNCAQLESVNIPKATWIGFGAFSGCSALKSIDIPEVTTIDGSAFASCDALVSIDIPKVTTIGSAAFILCYNLTSVNLPNATFLEEKAFNHCDNVINVSIPNVTTIGRDAFKYCYKLESIDMPNVTAIQRGTFSECRSLVSVDMPNVESIANDAFSICTNLTSVSAPKVTTIEDGAFGKKMYKTTSPVQSIVVSSALTSMGAEVFNDLVTVNCHSSDTNAVKAVFDAAGYNDLTFVQSEHNFVDGVCTICGEAEPEEDDFLTSFILNKDYNDKYNADTKVTKVSETLTYTIAPLTANAPAFANGGVVTMNVVDGVGAVEVALPAVDKAGEFWYTIKESEGSTAGVTYDESTYYLHLVTSVKDGEYGVLSAAIHTTAPADDGKYLDDDKITTVTNTYAEGKLTVTQEALVNGAPNTEDTFTETVTFTSDKTVTGNITYGDQTITPDMWKNGSVSVDIDLKGGDSIEFNGIPEGVTYTITQKVKADGYEAPTYAIDEEPGDEATETGITGTISDKEDNALIHNEKAIPIDVGVILENGAFILIGLGALTLAAWLVLSRKKEREFAAE